MRRPSEDIEIEEREEEDLIRSVRRWMALSELVAPLRPARWRPARRDAEEKPVRDPDRDLAKAG